MKLLGQSPPGSGSSGPRSMQMADSMHFLFWVGEVRVLVCGGSWRSRGIDIVSTEGVGL